MVRDARDLLNRKLNQRFNQQRGRNRQGQSQPNRNQITDAREILKRKKFQGVKKATFQRNQTPFRKQQIRSALTQQVAQRNFRNPTALFTRNFKNQSIRFPRRGNQSFSPALKNRPLTSGPKFHQFSQNRVVSDLAGLTVTTNQLPGHMATTAIDNGDELESMTLEDIQEMDGSGIPADLFKNKKVPSKRQNQQSTLFGRLSKMMEHTMIADSYAGRSPLESQNTSAWKVMVTNLQPAVSDDDIIELFSDIGNIKSAQIIEPCVALVEYFTKEDAMKAYERYHNRLLDGAPMQCSIQIESGRTPISSRLGEKFSPVSGATVPRRPNHLSFTQPSRRVAFTVKL